MVAATPANDVTIELDVHHLAASPFQQSSSRSASDVAACSLLFSVKCSVAQSIVLDWTKFVDVLLEEAGVAGFQLAQPAARADAIQLLCRSSAGSDCAFHVFDALLLETVVPPAAAPSGFAAPVVVVAPSPPQQQLWCRVATTEVGESARSNARISVITARQWNEVTRGLSCGGQHMPNGVTADERRQLTLSVTFLKVSSFGKVGGGQQQYLPPAGQQPGFGQQQQTAGAFGQQPVFGQQQQSQLGGFRQGAQPTFSVGK
jgi:hypothetical protein